MENCIKQFRGCRLIQTTELTDDELRVSIKNPSLSPFILCIISHEYTSGIEGT